MLYEYINSKLDSSVSTEMRSNVKIVVGVLSEFVNDGYVTGSHLYNTATEESDIDIAVQVELKNYFNLLNELRKLYTVEEILDYGNAITDAILRILIDNGKTIDIQCYFSKRLFNIKCVTDKIAITTNTSDKLTIGRIQAALFLL